MAGSENVGAWDVVVVPFPYSERLAEKRRPALVVSNETLHRDGFIWIAMITGSGKERHEGDLTIDDLEGAGLPGPSMVRASKLATIEPERIIRKIGGLAKSERRRVATAVSSFLAT